MKKDYKYGFRAKPGRDDLIIEWLENIQSNDKSYHIREALREYLTYKFLKNSATNAVFKPEITINKTENDVKQNSKKADAEVSDSALEDNLKSWID